MDTSKPYKIELVTKADSENILKMLKEFFFKDEPLNNFLDLGECEELEHYSLKCIKENCSFKAVHNNGEIIGVLLNGLMKRSDCTEQQAVNCKHPKFKKIMEMMDFIDSQFNIFSLYPKVDVILDGKILSVNSNYRGLGIAGVLTECALDYMRYNNIPIMHVLCSSYYSTRVVEKMGFQQLYELKYTDYKVNGINPLLPADPHLSAKIFIKNCAD